MTAWNEERILSMCGQEESLTLEFKSGDLLGMAQEKVAETLSKAVSGLANAQGGVLIIGIREEKRGKIRVGGNLDGVPTDVWQTDRLQQVIEGNIQPPLRVRVHRVALEQSAPGRVAFAIEVPEGSTAHQARDLRYYARSELSTNPLRDYEVRLRMHRATALSVKLTVAPRLKKTCQQVKQEQLAAYRDDLTGLRDVLVREGIDLGSPAHTPEQVFVSAARELGAGHPHLIDAAVLTDRLRYTEFDIALSIQNVCERTIRDFSVRVENKLPPNWILSQNDVQPKGGFTYVDPQINVREFHYDISALHVARGHRILPGMAAEIARFFVLVPESVEIASDEVPALLPWSVFLDDSSPSTGTIDVLTELRSVSPTRL